MRPRRDCAYTQEVGTPSRFATSRAVTKPRPVSWLSIALVVPLNAKASYRQTRRRPSLFPSGRRCTTSSDAEGTSSRPGEQPVLNLGPVAVELPCLLEDELRRRV